MASPCSSTSLLPGRLGWFAAVLLSSVLACATGATDKNTPSDDDDGSGGSGAGPGSGGSQSGGAGPGSGGSGATGGNGSGGSGVGGARLPLAGEVIVHEVMPNPNETDDTEGEWFELKNVSGDTLQLNGCVLSDQNMTPDMATIDGMPAIAPGGLALLAKSSNAGANGGLDNVAFSFGTAFTLANGSDEIILTCGGTTIDAIAYDGTTWPYGTGTAMQLSGTQQTAAANDSPAAWCAATSSYYLTDTGSPGSPTTDCP